VRFLFIHQNFPGQYRHVAPYLAARGHDVSGLGEKDNVLRQKPNLPGVKLLGYQAPPVDPKTLQPFIASLQRAIHRGRIVARGAARLHKSGFRPDVVAAHIGWGEALFLKDVFPESKLLLYCEFYYNAVGGDVGFDPEFPGSADKVQRLRVMNAPLLMALDAADHGIAPTAWQRRQFPGVYLPRITELHEGIDTDLVKPDPEARFRLPDGRTLSREDEVITYLSRNLEPYRGYHIYMRALPELQKRRPKAQFIIVGRDEVSYSARLPEGQTYRKRAMAEVGDKIDWSRVHLIPWLPYRDYVSMLQISAAHIYLTYPFVLSWSAMESMAAGCLLIARAGGDRGRQERSSYGLFRPPGTRGESRRSDSCRKAHGSLARGGAADDSGEIRLETRLPAGAGTHDGTARRRRDTGAKTGGMTR
jgi:glycosyltransferase involved in cell wall biosynthesis